MPKNCHKFLVLILKKSFLQLLTLRLRLLLALSVLEDWEIEALDVKTAFLYGNLDEELYMEQPEGFITKGQENKVYKLKKALYGLKQASLAWNKQADKSLKQLGFQRCLSDTGVYILTRNDSILVVILYVTCYVTYLCHNLSIGLKKHFQTVPILYVTRHVTHLCHNL